MGRTGGGGSRGGGVSHSSHSGGSRSFSSHRSGSSFSGSRVTSSSRISSTSRPSGGSSYRPSGGSYRPAPPPPPPPRPRYYGHSHHVYHHTGGYRRGGTSVVVTVFMIIILCAVLISVFSSMGPGNKIPNSTVTRERLNGGSFYDNCVIDDIGWVRDDGSSEAKLGANLKYFWTKTGIQPYVILLPWDSEYGNSRAAEDYCDYLFTEYVDREDAILLVYVDARYDDEDGDWYLMAGKMAGSVMDSEANEILYAYLDRYWFDLSYTVPQAIEKAFHDAADHMMEKTTNGWDVMKTVVIFAIVAAGICGIIAVMIIRRKHEAERAQETVDILQAGQNQQTYGTSSDPSMDDLTSRYDDK